MGTQLVSILIPFYNEGTLIQRAIMSCKIKRIRILRLY